MSETNESQSLNKAYHKALELDGLLPKLERRKVLRAAIFIRAASAKANPKASIKSQIENCERFIERQGWEVSDMYALKGGNCITRLIQARAKSGCFEVVVAQASYNCESPASRERTLSIMGVCDAKLFGSAMRTSQQFENESNRIKDDSNGEKRCQAST